MFRLPASSRARGPALPRSRAGRSRGPACPSGSSRVRGSTIFPSPSSIVIAWTQSDEILDAGLDGDLRNHERPRGRDRVPGIDGQRAAQNPPGPGLTLRVEQSGNGSEIDVREGYGDRTLGRFQAELVELGEVRSRGLRAATSR